MNKPKPTFTELFGYGPGAVPTRTPPPAQPAAAEPGEEESEIERARRLAWRIA